METEQGQIVEFPGKQPQSLESTIAFVRTQKKPQYERTCPECQQLKVVFYDSRCVACFCNQVGERIEWVECPDCLKMWSKLWDSGVCIECNENKEKDSVEKMKLTKKLKRLFGSEKSINELTIENFIEAPNTDKALLKANTFNPDSDNLYYWGPVGTGKTHLAYAIAQKWLRLGKSADILTTRALINRFRLCKPEEESERIAELVKVDVLVIDDLGITANSEFALDILCDILNRRSLNDKNGLIVTSNLFFNELSQKNNNDRLSSRLSGMCEAIEVDTGFDYRLERKKLRNKDGQG